MPSNCGLQIPGTSRTAKCLTLADPIANVYIDGSDKTGNFGMNVDDLVGLELPRQAEHVGDGTPFDHRHADRRQFRSRFLYAGVAVVSLDEPTGQS